MADDPRTVTVHHPEKGSIRVTPEVANALEAGNYGPYKRDEGEELRARIVELEAELAEATGNDPANNGQDGDMPEKADDRVDWIGTDPARAQAALDDETARGDKARKTVTDHIESVLNPTPNDPANNGQED